jgi:hypothetical protein
MVGYVIGQNVVELELGGALINASNPLPVDATVSIDEMSLSAEMKVDSGHDLYEATTVARTGDLAVSFDTVTGLTLAHVQSVENKTKGWIYSTKGATVTTTGITLVAGNQKTGYPVIASGDEVEIIYRGASRFATLATSANQLPPSTITSGSKTITTAGTREALATSTACQGVLIQAKAANTGIIYVGGTTVSATSGIFLYPGESVEISIDNLSKVYLDSSVSGEGVVFTYGVA